MGRVDGGGTVDRRERVNNFIEHHEIAWELGMAALAIVWVGLGFLLDEVPAGLHPELEFAELVLTGVFFAEFAGRLIASHDRSRYLRGHWIDALALAPPIRALRVLRLLRLLRLVRAFAGIYRASMHAERLARHRGFAWLIVAWLTIMVICSVALYAAEHGLNKTIDSPFDALWWGISTLSTVGYGDVYPVTPEGRLAAMVLMLLGIGLFSAITATIASYLISTGGQPDSSRAGRLVDEMERLASLREQGSLTAEEFASAKARLLG
jgi:voltage-gated potassium channel